ncbi:unnamed protein product [Fusarium equiseti]|uniref:Uncharacterized protein n=1 Tax=Fusarium equiseti TaxID=61235 RepID=A0A8J2J8I1_FUSEQ|nr:unnamed protein product [Fusarium equiseti]
MSSEDPVLDIAVADYLHSEANRNELLQFLRYQRENAPTDKIIPIEGLEIKSGLINSIIKEERKMLDKIQFAYLIRQSSDEVQSLFLGEEDWSDLTRGSQALSNLGPLTDHFLQKGSFVNTETKNKPKDKGKADSPDNNSVVPPKSPRN